MSPKNDNDLEEIVSLTLRLGNDIINGIKSTTEKIESKARQMFQILTFLISTLFIASGIALANIKNLIEISEFERILLLSIFLIVNIVFSISILSLIRFFNLSDYEVLSYDKVFDEAQKTESLVEFKEKLAYQNKSIFTSEIENHSKLVRNYKYILWTLTSGTYFEIVLFSVAITSLLLDDSASINLVLITIIIFGVILIYSFIAYIWRKRKRFRTEQVED